MYMYNSLLTNSFVFTTINDDNEEERGGGGVAWAPVILYNLMKYKRIRPFG